MKLIYHGSEIFRFLRLEVRRIYYPSERKPRGEGMEHEAEKAGIENDAQAVGIKTLIAWGYFLISRRGESVQNIDPNERLNSYRIVGKDDDALKRKLTHVFREAYPDFIEVRAKDTDEDGNPLASAYRIFETWQRNFNGKWELVDSIGPAKIELNG